MVYEVDAALVGETVALRYDPQANPRKVQVWHQGRFIAVARPVDLYANCFVKRDRPSAQLAADAPAATPTPSSLKLHQAKPEGR